MKQGRAKASDKGSQQKLASYLSPSMKAGGQHSTSQKLDKNKSPCIDEFFPPNVEVESHLADQQQSSQPASSRNQCSPICYDVPSFNCNEVDFLEVPDEIEDYSSIPIRTAVAGEDQQRAEEEILSQKLQVLYNTNPLNVIPESYEQESKNSILQESLQGIGGNKMHELTQESKRQFMTGDSRDYQLEEIPEAHQQSNYSKASRQETRKVKIEILKARLKQLFLNYCDFNVETGNIFITYSNFLKVIKDSNLIDDAKVTQNHISIILSKECNVTNNLIKTISFEQFLNCTLRISELKFPEIYRKHPKQALQALLKKYLIPLLERIEMCVETQSDDLQHSLYSVSEVTLKLIIYNEDTQVLFTDILPLLKNLYQKYFEQELSAGTKSQDLLKQSLKSSMTFVREFELSPYLVHQKACFLIWYSVAYATSIEELTNNPYQKSILNQSSSIGKSFTLGHFAIFMYRLSVIYFNHSQENAQSFNLIKKLLFFFRKLENCDGFKKFLKKLNRTYNESLSFMPSKDLLIQILKAEGIEEELMLTQDDYNYISKEAMVSRIVDPHLYQPPLNSKRGMENEEGLDLLQVNQEADQYLAGVEDDLKRIFEIYCSFGEPMNTKLLKSSKLMKMMRDCGIVKEQSVLPESKRNSIFQQISHFEVDLAFKQATSKQANQSQFDPLQSQMMSNFDPDYSSYQASGFLNFQSNSKFKFTPGPQLSSTSINKTMSFDYQSHLIEKGQAAGRLDFTQFKRVLELLSLKAVPSYPPTQGYLAFMRELIVPLGGQANEKRCIHSKKIQELLAQLDNQEMIDLLTILHKAVIDVYKIYADLKGHMNFTQFVQFCSDYDIFPHSATKAQLHRVFHSLSFINELMGMTSRSVNKSKMTNTMRSLDRPQSQQNNELIDEHLFIEALALCALFEGEIEQEYMSPRKDDQNRLAALIEQDGNQKSSVEKVLQFVEKMANADGLHKKLKRGHDLSSSIKCNLLDKRDLLEPFRAKYAWYFRNKYLMNMKPKKQNFQDIMEMSSVWTSSSQGEGDEY